MPKNSDKKYRVLSVRLTTEEYTRLEKIRGILQEKARNAGVNIEMSKPELIRHLLDVFLDQYDKAVKK